MFAFGKLVGSLLLPPGIFILLFVSAAILVHLGRKRSAMVVGLVSAATLWALSTTPVANLLIAPLEDSRQASFPIPSSGKPAATAIVVLGGGYLLHSPEYAGLASLVPESEARAVRGAELQRQTGLPLIFTGGAPGIPGAKESEADAALRFWLRQGIEPGKIELETKSRDTFENARYTKALAGAGPVYLVTSAWHMPRAILAFSQAGIGVIPVPTAYREDLRPLTAKDFLPDMGSLEISRNAIHEYLGLAWYRLIRH